VETVFETVRSVSLLLVTVLAALIVLAWLAVTQFKIGVKRLEREAEKLSREVDKLKKDYLQTHSSLPGVIEEMAEYLEATGRIIDRQRRSGPLTLKEAGYIGTLLDVTREIVKSILSTQEPLAQVTRCLRFRRSAMVKALRGLGEQIPDREYF
jgi:predicted PurR-regulated permease PerM